MSKRINFLKWSFVSIMIISISACGNDNTPTGTSNYLAPPPPVSDFSLSSNGRLIYNKPIKQLDYEQHSFFTYDMENGKRQDEIMVRDGSLFVVNSVGSEFSSVMLTDRSMAVDCMGFTVSHSQFGRRKHTICQANKNITTDSQSYSGSGSHSVSLSKGELFYIFEDLGGGSLGGMATGKHYRCLMTDVLKTKKESICKFSNVAISSSDVGRTKKVVKNASAFFNASMPMTIGDNLKIWGTTAEGSTITFDYQMFTVAIEDVNKEVLFNAIIPGQLKEYCGVAAYDRVKKPGIVTRFNFRDKNNKQFLSISHSVGDCT